MYTKYEVHQFAPHGGELVDPVVVEESISKTCFVEVGIIYAD